MTDLRATVRQAVAELDAEHRPDPEVPGPGGGCVICWPKDGTWPCLARMVADDLRALDATKEEG